MKPQSHQVPGVQIAFQGWTEIHVWKAPRPQKKTGVEQGDVHLGLCVHIFTRMWKVPTSCMQSRYVDSTAPHHHHGWCRLLLDVWTSQHKMNGKVQGPHI